MNAPYFITGLPRSRTAWLANLLTWGESFCWHEATARCGVDARTLKKWMAKRVNGAARIGNADPNLGLIAKAMLETFPESKFLLVVRDHNDCAMSLLNAMREDNIDGAPEDLDSLMMRIHSGMCLFLKLPWERVRMVRYEELDQEDVVRKVWRFCLPGLTFPRERYEMLQGLRVTQKIRAVGEATGLIARRAAA